MNKMFISFVILEIFISVFSIVPLWDFESSTINLLTSSSHEYYSYWGTACDYEDVKIKKTITKSGDSIIQTNQIIINNGIYITVDFEDIESVHCHNSIKYICPKGKFHMIQYLYNDGQSKLNIFKPNDFEESDYWELKCFYQPSLRYMFIGYLNKGNKFYYYRFDQENPWSSKSNNFHGKFYDFKWRSDGNENIYPMIYIY